MIYYIHILYFYILYVIIHYFRFVSFLSALLAIWLEPHQWFLSHMWGYCKNNTSTLYIIISSSSSSFSIFDVRLGPWLIFLAITEGLGFTLMANGQNFAPPTHAAIILSLEGVFAAVASFFYLGEVLTVREFFGCLIMLISTLVAEVGVPCIDRLSLPPVVAIGGTEEPVASDSKGKRRPLTGWTNCISFLSTTWNIWHHVRGTIVACVQLAKRKFFKSSDSLPGG